MGDHRRVPARTDFTFWWPVTVRWGDMDALGHVNNTLYLQYVESARVGFLERVGWGVEAFAATRQGPAVVSQTFHYRRQVVYPATLEVGLRCGEIRHRSFDLECAIFRTGTDILVGNGNTVLAWTDLSAGRAVEIPAAVRSLLAAPGTA